MKLPALLATDLHLTANPRDEYRWGLWSWLRKQCAKEGVQTLALLGDLTDAKDYHPAELVNRIVAEVKLTLACVPRIIILQGNHDYLRSGHPFFSFLSALPGVTFARDPLDTGADGEACLFLPHTKTPLKDWGSFDWSMHRYVFMHQTVSGAIASNGQAMDGDAFPDMSAAGKVYSGDIHVPQIIRGVEYVGSPYHVHFGDKFRPRCLLIDAFNKTHDLHFRTLSRVTLDCGAVDIGQLAEQHRLRSGDQVKLRVHLQPSEMHDWHVIKRLAADELKKTGVECFGIELIAPRVRRRIEPEGGLNGSTPRLSAEDAILAFVEREGLGGEALDVGLEALE